MPTRTPGLARGHQEGRRTTLRGSWAHPTAPQPVQLPFTAVLPTRSHPAKGGLEVLSSARMWRLFKLIPNKAYMLPFLTLLFARRAYAR